MQESQKNDPQYWINHLSLIPHPEGGYYKETYRSSDVIPAGTFAQRFSGARSVCTGIYYLVTEGNFSAFHRIRSDEMWHFYAGGALEIEILHQGVHSTARLGIDLKMGELPQFVVPAGAWFASIPAAGSKFCLAGCTVSPGFDFADFEIADREKLSAEFPQHQQVIAKLTRIRSASD